MYKKALIFLVFLPILASAQTDKQTSTHKVFSGCSGGMMVHAGYLFGNDVNAPLTLNGATIGVGGAARVHLFNHLRFGAEGYVSTMPASLTDHSKILATGSYLRNGWGGFITDAYWQFDKIWLYTGATIGGGAMKCLYIESGDNSDWLPETKSTIHKQAFFCVVPFVGIDYLITPRVHATFKIDWQIAISQRKLQLPTGPKFYVGILFCH